MQRTPSELAACPAATQPTAAAARLGKSAVDGLGKTQAYQNRTKLKPPMFPRDRPVHARRTRPPPVKPPLPAPRGPPRPAAGAPLSTALTLTLNPNPNP